MHYLWGSRHWCLSCETQSEDKDLFSMPWTDSQGESDVWELYVNSDFAGNSEPPNKRGSQIGILAMHNGFPVFWSSNVSSVAFADKDIREAHADISSGAAEVYAAGKFIYDYLYLSHIAEKMGVDFHIYLHLLKPRRILPPT